MFDMHCTLKFSTNLHEIKRIRKLKMIPQHNMPTLFTVYVILNTKIVQKEYQGCSLVETSLPICFELVNNSLEAYLQCVSYTRDRVVSLLKLSKLKSYFLLAYRLKNIYICRFQHHGLLKIIIASPVSVRYIVEAKVYFGTHCPSWQNTIKEPTITEYLLVFKRKEKG